MLRHDDASQQQEQLQLEDAPADQPARRQSHAPVALQVSPAGPPPVLPRDATALLQHPAAREAPRSTPQQEPLSLAMVSTVVGDDSDAGQPDLVTDGYRWESVRWEDGMQSHQCPLYNFAGADEASGSAIVHVHNSSNGAVVGNRQFECRSRGLSSLRTMDSSQVARRRDRNNFPRQFGQGAKKLLCLLACCSYRPAVRPAQNQGPRAANP
jgi:hypothetical protein